MMILFVKGGFVRGRWIWADTAGHLDSCDFNVMWIIYLTRVGVASILVDRISRLSICHQEMLSYLVDRWIHDLNKLNIRIDV